MKIKRRHSWGLIFIVWLAFFITDISLANSNKSPLFAIPIVMYKDGGSTEYYGLGYKVIKYVKLTAENGTEVIKTDFGTWFMEFSYPEDNSSRNDSSDRIPILRISRENSTKQSI